MGSSSTGSTEGRAPSEEAPLKSKKLSSSKLNDVKSMSLSRDSNDFSETIARVYGWMSVNRARLKVAR